MWHLLLASALAAPSAWTAEALTLQGRGTSLALIAGHRPLVLVVMKRTDCAVCRAELERLLASSEARIGAARVVAVAADPVLDEDPMRRSIAHDPGGRLVADLGLWRGSAPMPALVVFDRCGDERGRVTGRNPAVSQEAAADRLLHLVEQNPGTCAQLAS